MSRALPQPDYLQEIASAPGVQLAAMVTDDGSLVDSASAGGESGPHLEKAAQDGMLAAAALAAAGRALMHALGNARLATATAYLEDRTVLVSCKEHEPSGQLLVTLLDGPDYVGRIRFTLKHARTNS